MTITPSSLGFTLLPPDPTIISPDLALDAALAPVVDPSVDPVEPFGKGWHFDFVANEFVYAGGTPHEAFGADHLVTWIEKCLRTARYAHPIYGDDFGVAGGPYPLVGEPQDGDLVAEYQDAVEEALLVHDRIVAVEDFAFTSNPYDDVLYMSFTVILDEGGDAMAQPLQITNLAVTAAA